MARKLAVALLLVLVAASHTANAAANATSTATCNPKCTGYTECVSGTCKQIETCGVGDICVKANWLCDSGVCRPQCGGKYPACGSGYKCVDYPFAKGEKVCVPQ